MRRVLLLLLLISSMKMVDGQADYPTINCDSIRKIYRTQIDSLKKNADNTVLVQQMEQVLKQLEELYCKVQKNLMPDVDQSANIMQQNNAGDMSDAYMARMMQKGKRINASFAGTYIIRMRVTGGETNNADLSYYLDPHQQKILLDESSFSADPSVKNTLIPDNGNEGRFDGWLIDATGQNQVFTSTKEMGKIAMEMKLGTNRKDPGSKAIISVKPGNGLKKIAGYDCTPYAITITEGKEKLSFTCWISKNGLPFMHPSYTMFSMFSANQLLKKETGKRAVLSIEGRTEEGAYNYTVVSIKPQNKKVSFNGYQTYKMPTGLF